MAHLVGVPLPVHGASYTVISHQFVIDYSKQQLAAAGFVIVDEEYRCTADGQIAQGVYKLNFNSDPDLSMMFAWTNSYNKQVKFKCLVGAYINKTGTVMTSGELGTWTRKHTGTADTETKEMIDSQITNAHMYYAQLVADKAAMEDVSLNKRRQAQMLGILFAEFQILTTEQASIVRQQMDRPSFVFNSSDSLWAFYNYVTIALQHSHPRTWMEDQRILHYFISTVCNFTTPPQPVSAPVLVPSTPVQEEEVDPNQTNLLDQIAEMEAEEFPIPEVIEYEEPFVNDEVITYTDPAGNTFEAPVVPPCAGHDTETEKDIEEEMRETEVQNFLKEVEPAEGIMENIPEDDFSLPGENSLMPSPADYELMEAMESSVGTPAVADLDAIPVEKKVEEISNDEFDLDFSLEEDPDDSPDFF